MIGIKKTGICEGCTEIELDLYGNSLDHEYQLYCKHESACMRVVKIMSEKHNGGEFKEDE